MKRLGIPASANIHTGDRLLEDVAGARRAGMHAVWRTAGVPAPAPGLRADFTIWRLDELIPAALTLEARAT
ncbi:MAG: HAD hydrolase-like protein [Bacillota bacterium]